ncbi:DNA repair exonuclease SbcCD ATPase subunit [Angulomicrobium tetraedrale]|uniref:DNA repair exonuclease SbcCD ATPase subunit n=1 Tax=Ancylobacter tetraedralis TaxID=217068 RepID=A0A839ZDP8_9HYPH|nr:hypothetical protein [Ancylobacter tetraedralis]MBB3772923.1 DNA repair exonuclease SbcCD ATPase subunit [Ancylobacter tetraedralis]
MGDIITMRRKLGTAISFAILTMAASALGGCQTSCTGNPATDDLSCARQGLNSGRYAQDTQAMAITANRQTAIAADARLTAAVAQQSADTARANRAAVQRSVQQQNAELEQLRRELADSEQRLAGARSTSSSAEIEALESDVARLRRQIQALQTRS